MSRPAVLLRAAALVAAVAVALTGCAQTSAQPGHGIRLTIGSPTTTEGRVIAAIYGVALSAQGYVIDYNGGVGNRTRMLDALTEGRVDITPEETGDLLAVLDPVHANGSPDVAYGFLQSAAETRGLTVLQPAEAQNAPVYVTTREFSSAHGIQSIGDLAAIDSAITIGSALDLDAASYGRSGLSYSYNVTGWHDRAAVDDEAALDDLRANNTQVACVTSLSLDGEDDDVVTLLDPRHIILDERVVPIVNSGRMDATIQTTLDAVSRALTTDDLAAFMDTTDQLPETVARAWLVQHELLAPAAD